MPDPLEEGGVLPQFPAVELMWVEDTYRESEFVGDDPNWLRQVGIICDEDRHLELLREDIPKKMRGEVHVRAFLFRLVHPNLLRGCHVW